MGQDMAQQSYKTKTSSAMSCDKVYVSNVLRLGTAQQCNKTGYTLVVFQDWELFSNVIRQGIHRQCFRIWNSSAK